MAFIVPMPKATASGVAQRSTVVGKTKTIPAHAALPAKSISCPLFANLQSNLKLRPKVFLCIVGAHLRAGPHELQLERRLRLRK